MNDKPVATEAFDPAANGWDRVRGHNFGELVGPIWRRGDALFGFLAADKHRNHRGIVHGGMLTTFADQAMGMTGRRATGDKPHATIQIAMQFIGAVKVGDFVEAHCEIVRKTRSLLFIESKLKVGADIAATASGVWKILGER
jgi:acyl-coenzyme A thioesterase PaaI-like protein